MKILNTLPAVWIITTILYTVLLYFLDLRLGYTVVFSGLFVPISVANFGAALDGGNYQAIVIPLVLLVVFCGEYIFRKKGLVGRNKFAWILCVLFILTIVVDLIIWGTWQSLGWLLTNGMEGGM